MTSSTILLNQRLASSSTRMGNKMASQTSIKAASASRQPRSFIAALVKALSAFAV